MLVMFVWFVSTFGIMVGTSSIYFGSNESFSIGINLYESFSSVIVKLANAELMQNEITAIIKNINRFALTDSFIITLIFILINE